jgi:hypothetical protein
MLISPSRPKQKKKKKKLILEREQEERGKCREARVLRTK